MKNNNVEVVVSGMNISATVAENEVKVVSKYRCSLTMKGIYPAVDMPALFKECKKLYSAMLKIGVKDEYSEEELNRINAFFAVSTFVNYKTPKIIDIVKADYVVSNLTVSGHPHSVLTFENYATGFEDVHKPTFFTDEKWIDDDNICQSKCDMTVGKLNAGEVKRFIEYCQKNTFKTLNLLVVHYKSRKEDVDNE